MYSVTTLEGQSIQRQGLSQTFCGFNQFRPRIASGIDKAIMPNNHKSLSLHDIPDLRVVVAARFWPSNAQVGLLKLLCSGSSEQGETGEPGALIIGETVLSLDQQGGLLSKQVTIAEAINTVHLLNCRYRLAWFIKQNNNLEELGLLFGKDHIIGKRTRLSSSISSVQYVCGKAIPPRR